MTFSIGFHVSVGGNPTGIGAHMEELDAAGIPFGLVSIGNYGAIREGVLLMRASGVPHVLIYRVTDLDVPDYALDPATAALNHWDGVKAKLPPEFDKEQVWICPINEVDKNRADWLGHFATAFAALAMGEGYRVTMFGWSSGEPEPEHWQLPGMRRYLELCALHPDKAAVALHEYSYEPDVLNVEYPYKIGRFQALFDACDSMGIARPTVHITEFGWTHEEVPEPAVAVPQIAWAYGVYGPHPQIKIVVIWGLISGFAGIANLAQRLIAPVTQFMLNAPAVTPIPPIVPPPAPPPAPPPSGNLDTYLWNEARGYANQHGLQYTAALGLWKELEAKGYKVEHRELVRQHGGKTYAIQRGVNTAGVELLGIWTAGQPLRFITEPGSEPLPTPPPGQLRAKAWPTPTLRVNQWFAANPQNYSQFNLPGHDGLDGRAATGEMITAVAPGVVYLAGPSQSSPNYGIQVRLDHGDGHKTVYAHLQEARVTVGQVVTAGQLIGLADNTGNSFGSHLHLTYKQDGKTYTDPAGNVWPNSLFDPWLCLEPLYDSYLATAGITGYLWANSTVKHPHFDWGFGLTNLNLRQEGKTDSPILGLVQAGVPFRITGPKTPGGYYPAVALLGDRVPGVTLPPSTPRAVDLLPYLRGDGRIYTVKHPPSEEHPNGAQEDVQVQAAGNAWLMVKNSNYESFYLHNDFIWRDIDISPGPAPRYDPRPGVHRYYTTKEPGQPGARWCKRHMAIGETYTGPGHHVQFYYKENCQPSPANSGNATNRVTLVARHAQKEWDGFTVQDVVELQTNTGESMFFAKNFGLVAWGADWGASHIVEVSPPGRPSLEREIVPCL